MNDSLRRCTQLCLTLCLALWLSAAAFAAESDLTRWDTEADDNIPTIPGSEIASPFSPGARELARQLNMSALVDDLRKLQLHNQLHPTDHNTLSILFMRQRLTDTVLTTLLEVQTVLAEIDQEITRSDELRAFMESKRDRNVRLNSTINFLTTGTLGIISSAIQIPPGASNIPGNTLETAASSLQTGLSTFALKQEGGARHSSGINPNMLAKVFGLPYDAKTDYPESVWSFINAVPAGIKGGVTRKDYLIRRWENLERIAPRSGRNGNRNIQLLAGTILQTNSITIDLLDDRSAMLSDLRAMVSLINKDLLDLLVGLRSY